MVWEFSSLALTSSTENIFEPGISTIKSFPFFTFLLKLNSSDCVSSVRLMSGTVKWWM